MKKYQKIAPIAALVSLACLPLAAHATNGYFSHGYGIKAKGMAGAGIAYGQDAISAAINPANMVLVGNRVDFGLEIFRPDRSTQIAGNGSLGTVNYDPNDDDIFLIPEFGYNQMINADMSVGVSVFGNGGLNTSYKQPIGLFGTTNAGVNLEQLFISPTFAMNVNPQNAFGVSLNLIYQRFEATGLQNFAGFSTSSSDLTDNGTDTSTGFNIRLGWTGQINPMVSWGVTYQSEADMSEFDDYKGLFAEQGDFDIPETYGIGIKVSPSSNFNVAFDITRINYSEVRSIANTLTPAILNCAGGDVTQCLGANAGSGFGWEDMTVYKLGVDWQVNPDLVLRAGWNHGDQPIPTSETFFNLLAPGVVEDHLTLGGTWTLQNGSELSFYYMHAFEEDVNGNNSIPAAFGSGEANLSMSQDAVGVAYGWDF